MPLSIKTITACGGHGPGMYILRTSRLMSPFTTNPRTPSLSSAEGLAHHLVDTRVHTLVLWGRQRQGTERLLYQLGQQLAYLVSYRLRVIGPPRLVRAFWQGFSDTPPVCSHAERAERARQQAAHLKALLEAAYQGVPLPGGELLQLRGDAVYVGTREARPEDLKDASGLARAVYATALDWLHTSGRATLPYAFLQSKRPSP